MSKLETVRALDASAPQLQIVESVKALQETLKALPDAVALEVANALSPLRTLPQDVRKALEAFDAITAQQRRSLDALAEQMTESAAKTFQAKAAKLDASLNGLKALEQTAQQIRNAPEALEQATEDMRSMAAILIQSADRPRWWKTALLMIFATAIGGTLAASGQAALTRYLPPSEIQQNAEYWRVVWKMATPKERKSIEAILNRPE